MVAAGRREEREGSQVRNSATGQCGFQPSPRPSSRASFSREKPLYLPAHLQSRQQPLQVNYSSTPRPQLRPWPANPNTPSHPPAALLCAQRVPSPLPPASHRLQALPGPAPLRNSRSRSPNVQEPRKTLAFLHPNPPPRVLPSLPRQTRCPTPMQAPANPADPAPPSRTPRTSFPCAESQPSATTSPHGKRRPRAGSPGSRSQAPGRPETRSGLRRPEGPAAARAGQRPLGEWRPRGTNRCAPGSSCT